MKPCFTKGPVALGAALMVGVLLGTLPVAHAELPRVVENLRSLLEQTACLVEGDVAAIDHSFDPRSGPRGSVHLTHMRTLLGACTFSELKLRLFGGPVPDGRVVVASEMPRFVKGARYVMFLRNTEWFYTPVHFPDLLRVENVGGRDLLVDDTGRVLRGIALEGLVYHEQPLFEPVRELLDPKRPELLPGADLADLEVRLDPSLLARRLQQFAAVEEFSVQGTFRENPRSDRVWNRVPTSPERAPPVTGRGNDPVCDPSFQSCDGDGDFDPGRGVWQ
jgi:hypothetical protein